MTVTETQTGDAKGRRNRIPDSISRYSNALIAILGLITAIVLLRSAELTSQRDKLEAEVSNLNAELGSITRSVGGVDEAFDVRQILVDEADVSEIPTDYEPVDEDRFYRPRAEQDGWTFERKTELDHIADFTGTDSGSLPARYRPLEALDINVWRQTDTHQITDPKGDIIANGFTSLTLERLTADEVFNVSSRVAGIGEDSEYAQLVEALGAEDLASVMLQLQIGNQLASISSNSGPVLQAVEKNGPFVYAKTLTLLSDVVVDGRHHNEYFFSQEMFLVDLDSELVFITTTVPTPDRRSADFQLVTSLLTDLRIVR